MKIKFLILVSILLSLTTTFAQNTGRKGFQVSEKSIPRVMVSDQTNETSSNACDTLGYPFAWDKLYYFITPPDGSGYITGNNSFRDKVIAEYFTAVETGTQITGMLADFSVAFNTHNPEITFAIWNNAGEDGKPGSIVASATKTLSSIVSDINNQRASWVTFDQTFTVTGPFYAGILLPVQTGDTLALWCKPHADGYDGTAWLQWNDNTWHAFSDPDSWGSDMQTSLTIHPIVCQLLGIDDAETAGTFATPTPSTGIVNIKAWKTAGKISLEVFSPTGKKVYSRAFPGSFSSFNIDLSSLSKGMYIVRMSDGKKTSNQKLLLK